MTTLVDRDRLGALLFYGVLVILAWLVFRVFRPFLVPLAWAVVLVVVFYPWHERLEARVGAGRAAALSTLGVALVLILPTLLVMTAFVHEGLEAVRRVQDALAHGDLPWVQRAWAWVQQRAVGQPVSDLRTIAREGAERVAGFLALQAGAVLRNVALFLFHLFVVVFAMFYLFRDAGEIVAGMRRLLPFEAGHRERLIAQARDLIFASVTSSLIVAALQGFLGGLVFALLGLGAPVFWGVVMAFFALLPLVGAWVVWLPAAGWLMLNGQVGRGVILVGLGAGVIGLVDNVLRPMLIGGRTRLSGLLVFISVLGGIGLFGVLGVVLGPIVVATAASVFDVYAHPGGAAAETHPGETIRRGKSAVLE